MKVINGETAKTLFDKVKNRPRDPRSDAYWKGVYTALYCRFNSLKIENPFEAGTAESDAFTAGCDEGKLRFKWLQDGEAV